MSSASTTSTGQYMYPLITDQTDNGDPWKRNYYVPPIIKPLIPRTHPLIDLRSEVSRPDFSSVDMLSKYGVGVVKHHSPFLDQLSDESAKDENFIQVYHQEIKELILKTLKAKTVFITTSVFRQGKRTPSDFKLPTELKSITSASAEAAGRPSGNAENLEAGALSRNLTGQSNLNLSTPLRLPHIDYTPLGARQVIRRQAQDIYDVANQCGIIAYEDSICKDQPFTATAKESDPLIAANYNLAQGLGPRYAAFSIWRPLSKVYRDPLTFAPRTEPLGDEYVYWPYLNRFPGPQALGGDFLKEYVMLGTRSEQNPDSSPHANGNGASAPKWYYLSEQEPDEVMFIRLFDSASLGPHARQAPAPWHASPEIGEGSENHSPRESIDLRVLIFW